MSTLVNRRDLAFLLYDWLHIESLCEQPLFKEHDRETFDMILDMAERLAEEKFFPHAQKVDEKEPHFDGEKVHIIPEVKEALDAHAEAGFLGMSFDAEWGGMQLPYTISQACNGIFYAANVSTAGYPMLTMGAANLLAHHGTEQQKSTYMLPMIEGRFYGTMCLSEPQAGSSLSDLRTKATPHEDGTYRVVGNKMWISGGEHDLSENIIHLVLARLPGAPAGVKGISLFIVPKYLLNKDGSLGQRNDVQLAGINHKMGYRGTINTVLNFGEEERCVGYLVGEPHHGLRYMFHMMNEARIAVGLGASMLGYTGFLHSLAYARQRPQGRHPGAKDPTQPPVPIIEHADVKRMLLAQKAYAEGALALCLYCAKLFDQQRTAPQEEQAELGLLLDLLTPIAKAWPSEYCLEANKLAIQVLGGDGYTREYHVERFYRDNRLNPIHEGTNGIQALDLLGRKVTMKQGAALQALQARVEATLAQASNIPALEEFVTSLKEALGDVVQTTMVLMQTAMKGEIDLYLANASVYLNLFGHTVLAWIWLEQAVALQRLDDTDATYKEGKMRACQYFYRWELPHTKTWAKLLQSLDETCLKMPTESF